jgi:ribose-phosphate pyrophosphokinase
VTGFKKPNVKQLMLFTGRAYPGLAREIADLMGVDIVATRALNYANSEIYVRFEESVRGSDAFVIQSHTAPVNEWLMEQLIMVDALKRASAKRITVVARPPGQEASRSGTDFGTPGSGSLPYRRGEPADVG